MEVINSITQFGSGLFGPVWPVIWNSLKIVCVILPIFGCVAYLTLWERKAIGWMQVRKGPNRVGPLGLLQPIADALKLMLKEIIVPAAASKVLYIIAPIMTLMPALAAWAVMPFGPDTALANINAGLLYLLAITSIEVYGVILAGWASNSKYAFLGAMRASAQMVSYELAIGFAIVCVVMVSGSLNMTQIVLGQDKGIFADAGWNFLSWNWLPLLPIFVVYVISAIAETNRHPFDVVEGESEIVAGHMVEYSGMAFALFFLAEYANMILLSALAAVMFLGGWTAPIEFAAFGMKTPQFILDTMWFWNWLWLFIKTFCVVSMFIWARASFPRYRYDQIMRLGWKIFIPVTLAYIVFLAIWMYSPLNIWK